MRKLDQMFIDRAEADQRFNENPNRSNRMAAIEAQKAHYAARILLARHLHRSCGWAIGKSLTEVLALSATI